MSTIKYAADERGVAVITLDRDEKRNAVNREMADRILDALDQAERENMRAVILRANRGVKIWCAGYDLEELDLSTFHDDNPILDVAKKIQSTPLPVVAKVEGRVYAGGLIILLCADIVIAAENADAAITSNKLGVPLPPELYAYWLRVMGIHKTKELLFTAAPITAADALQAGLYNHVVEREQLEQTTNNLLHKILKCSPEALANAKRQLNLIASQSALSDADLAHIQQRNTELLENPATKRRIIDLLSSSGG